MTTIEPRVYVFTENRDKDVFARQYAEAIERAGFSVKNMSGESMSDYSRIDFEKGSTILTMRYPTEDKENDIQFILLSVKPYSSILDQGVQQDLKNLLREVGESISPAMAYIGDARRVFDPEGFEKPPDLGMVTYINKKFLADKNIDVLEIPGCTAEKVGEGYLISPPDDIVDSGAYLEEAAEFLDVGLVDSSL